MKKFTTLTFREHCLKTYPGLTKKDKYRKFFMYLCFGSFFDEDTEKLLIDAATIARNSYNIELHNQRHFTAIDFLKEFQANVLPEMIWNEADCNKNKARTISNCGLKDETLELIQLEIAAAKSNDKYNFITGQKAYAKIKQDCAEKEKAEYDLEMSAAELNPAQRLIVNYMQNLKSNSFNSRLNANKELIEAEINKIENKVDKNGNIIDVKTQQMKVYDAIMENPIPRYYLSQSGNTTRLFGGNGQSILNLKSSVRKALCHGWVDCDLKSSQFSILAKTLNAEIALDKLKDPEFDLWKYCQEKFELVEITKDIKKQLKKLIYGLAFGMSKGKMRLILDGLGIDPKLFFENAMFAELLKLRGEWYKAIVNGQAATHDCFGDMINFWEISHGRRVKRTPNKIGASYIQAIELDIICAAFEVIQNRYSKSATIQLFQHDGICVNFFMPSKKGTIIKAMQKAVKERALSRHGVITRLETEDL